MAGTQTHRPLGLALLSIVAGVVMTAFSGWMTFRMLVCPVVDASRFRADQYHGDYIQLTASRAIEVGHQVEYSPSDPAGADNPSNRVARLLAVPVDHQLLIVLVPMDHQGTSYKGTVKELSSDIEMALTLDSASQSLRELGLQLESLQQQSQSERMDSEQLGNNVNSLTRGYSRSVSLRDLALPVYLDAKEDERGALALVLVVGLAFLVGGIYILKSPHRGLTNKREPDLTATLPSSLAPDFMTQEQRLRLTEATEPDAINASSNSSAIELCCPNGHSFQIPLMYRGTRRKCPVCGSMVEA